MRIHRSAVLLLPAVCLWFSTGSAQQSRVSAIDSGRSQTLRGRVPAKARGENDLGQVDAGFRMPAMTLMLKATEAQQEELRKLLSEQQDPASPRYHQWLTPEEYAARFGASTADADKIAAWLRSEGFTVEETARSRNWITFSGTAGQVRKTFQTEIHRYRDGAETRFANASDPSVPAAIAGVVSGIRGLTDFGMQPRLRKPSSKMTSAGGVHHLAPDDVATIYNIQPLYDAGIDGTGQRLAVVGQSSLRATDITGFRSRFNLPPMNLEQVLVPGSRNPGVQAGDIDEANLDVQWAGAVARKATIVYVYSTDVWQSAMYAVDQNLAPVLSMSYGLCEQADLIDLPDFQTVARQANAQGITWLAAAGDAGAADCDNRDALTAQNGVAVDSPASIPEITGMGGTMFNEAGGAYWAGSNTVNNASALSYIPEVAWNDTYLGDGLAAGGGGRSVYFTRPSWQSGPGVPNDGARHVPDISLSSSANHVGYYVFTGGTGVYFGGTSAAAPAMAGIVALLNQYLLANGTQTKAGLGNINPALYRLAQAAPQAFHDVTGGNNAVPCTGGSPSCVGGMVGHNAGAGYDHATGLGSIDAYNLAKAWSSNPARFSAVTAAIDQNPVFQQAADANGNGWRFQLRLNEENGIGTSLTAFTVDGVDYTSRIGVLFGGAAIGPRGTITANMAMNVAQPKTVVFQFTGTDAGGSQWSTQLAVPFQAPRVRLSVGGISNAASGQTVYAPGMILSVYGTGMGALAQSAGAIPLPDFLGSFAAYINGAASPIYYVSPNQVNIQIPYETQPGIATLILSNPYEEVTYRFRVAEAGPGIFTFQDGYVNPFRGAKRGETVTLFVTGEGRVTPALSTGNTPSSRTPIANLPRPQQVVTVTVGGAPATIPFIGIPSGLVGVTQVNFTIPGTAPLGTQPIVVTVGGVASAPANFEVQ
jgi:uncharacterized protein (TIGR03437 family)